MIRVRIKRRKKKLGYKEWWDRSCTRKKRIVYRLYKGWRIGKSSRERFLEERRSFKEHVEEKKRKWKEKKEKELRNLKNEAEVWKIINKKRGKSNWAENSISKESWMSTLENCLEERK
ncbi:hypothetical protein P5V15_014703 [Pogonomyrmex californicus]